MQQGVQAPRPNEDFFDWDGTPDSNVLPTGTYQFYVEKLDDVMSKGGKDGISKRMISAQYIVEEPPQFRGMSYFENLVLGSAEAPRSAVPGSMGTRNFKGLMKACQVPKGNSMQQLMLTAANAKAKFVANVIHRIEEEGEYKGTPRNNITRYLKLGEAVPGLAEAPGGAPAGMGTTMPSGAMPPPMSTAPSPTAPTGVAPPPTQPEQPALVQPMQPAAPEPVSPAPPVQTTMPQTPGPAPTAGPAGHVHRCNICNTDVPVLEFEGHVQAHIQRGDVKV